MIVCSCNVLSHTQILATLHSEDAKSPRSPVQAYGCLGCAPQCGRCLATVRALLANARGADCQVGCAICPGHNDGEHSHEARPALEPYRIAAE
jgi:bacterioferritin-associated ferredoxin